MHDRAAATTLGLTVCCAAVLTVGADVNGPTRMRRSSMAATSYTGCCALRTLPLRCRSLHGGGAGQL